MLIISIYYTLYIKNIIR